MDDHFTTGRKAYTKKLSKILEYEVSQLRSSLKSEVSVLEGFGSSDILLSFTLKVNFPTGGIVNNIAIRSEEPVFLLIDLSKYPFCAPLAFSDRKDFPTATLPHLNPVPDNLPANFCLHRGDIDDWFAEHTLVDYVIRLKSWLNDAVANRLIRNKDEFEVTRINSSIGFFLFDQNRLLSEVEASCSSCLDAFGFYYRWCELLLDSEYETPTKERNLNYKHIVRISDVSGIEKYKDLTTRINENKTGYFHRRLFGITVFPDKKQTVSRYFGQLPKKLGDLLRWCTELELPLHQALDDYNAHDLDMKLGVPVSVVIPRPQKVIRHIDHREILNFLLFPYKDNKINNESDVYLLDHRFPVTTEKARELSGFTDSNLEKTVLIGCGALGSKIGLHLARSGESSIHFVDRSSFSPHNLIRHGLLSESIGKYKAEELSEQVNKIFTSENVQKSSFDNRSITNLLSEQPNFLKSFKTVIDATASGSVFNLLSQAELQKGSNFTKCEIANDGSFGLAFFEGRARNPRIDDLLLSLFDVSLDRKDVSQWLLKNRDQQSDLTSQNEEIMIGLGCNSDTFKLADEVVSFHASMMSGFLRKKINQDDAKSSVFLCKYENEEQLRVSSEEFTVKPFNVVNVKNDRFWQVRVKSGIGEEIFSLLEQESPNETGGLLIGRLSHRNKTVHITRIIPAPPDSKKTPYLFTRGGKGLSKRLSTIRRKSGNLLDFVGEWHTHPRGGSRLSDTDKQAITELRQSLDPVPFPTLVMIVTPNKLHPYMFGPK
jgi:integrative and conjugative element protein (TIGR02256 family)